MRRTVKLRGGQRLLCGVVTLTFLVAWHTLAWGESPSNAGIELFNRHDFTGAAAAFEADLQHNPNDLTALIYLGRIAFEQNHIEEAARRFEQATTVAPQDSAAFHWLGRAYGVQARELGPPRGILPARRTKKALEKAVALDPNNLDARLDLATYYREAPGIVGGSRRAALAQVQEIRRRDPCLGELAQGDMAMDEKRFDDAQRSYEAAIQLNGQKTDAYFRLGVLHQRTGQFEKAFLAFEKMLTLDRGEKRAYFQIGKTADLSGQRLDEGEAALKTYLGFQPFYIMPKLAWAHRRLGNIYLKKGRSEAALEEYRAAVKLAPDDQEAVSALEQLERTQRKTSR